MTIAEAYQAAKARAQERCEACQQQKAIDADGFFFVGQTKCRQVNDPHTCDRDLKIVKDAMLAAARAAGQHGRWSDDKGKAIPCQGCELCSAEAEIERLFEGSEGGKE